MHPHPNLENLGDFVSILKRGIEHGRATGQLKDRVSEKQVNRLIAACEQPIGEPFEGKAGEPVFLHRLWRLRIARMYWRQNGRDPDERPWNIDWEAIWSWIVENIVPIVRALLPLLLFLI